MSRHVGVGHIYAVHVIWPKNDTVNKIEQL